MQAGIRRGMVAIMTWGVVSGLTGASAVHAQDTQVTLDSRVTSTIPGLSITPVGTYTVPGPLSLPQTNFSGNLLSHDGGSFTFGSSVTTNTYSYGNWILELLDSCSAIGNPCEVATSGGNPPPFAVRNFDSQTGTADLVFTQSGAAQFNDLQGITLTLPFITVFVTNSPSNANLGGLSGADTLCTSTAASAGLQGQYTAWLSDSTTDARDRIADGEYRLPDQTTIVASSLADLTDGTLNNPINQTADGITASNQLAWTGTQSDGTLAAGTANAVTCDDWTNGGGNSGTGLAGDNDEVNQRWTDDSSAQCGALHRIYCFSDRFLPEASFATNVVTRATQVPSMDGAAARTMLILALLATALGMSRAYRKA